MCEHVLLLRSDVVPHVYSWWMLTRALIRAGGERGVQTQELRAKHAQEMDDLHNLHSKELVYLRWQAKVALMQVKASLDAQHEVHVAEVVREVTDQVTENMQGGDLEGWVRWASRALPLDRTSWWSPPTRTSR